VACHGEFGTWNTNVADHLQGGNLTANHIDDGTSTYDCGECHVIEDADYLFTYGSADWNPNAGETSHHGDGQIQINSDAAYDATTDQECKKCHTANSAAYEVGDTGWPVDENLLGVTMAGNCSGCHIAGSYNYPEGENTDDDGVETNTGAHQKHADAIVASPANGVSNPNNTCDFCHPANSHGGPDATLPADMGGYKTIAGNADGDALFNMDDPSGVGAKDNTCTTVDCHSNSTTPDWYTTGGGGGPSTTPPTTSNVRAAWGSTISFEITVAEGTLIDLTATVSDSDSGHTISGAEYSLDDSGFSSPVAMEATDGTFNSASENVEDPAAPGKIDTSGWSVGAHYLYVHGQDNDGWGSVSYATVNITAAPAGPDSVTLTASNDAPAAATQGGAYSFLQLDFTVNTAGDSSADIDRVQVNSAGTAADGDVSQVAIYEDTDTSATWNAGDVLLGTGTFVSSTVDIDIVDVTVTNSTPITLFAALTMASDADSSATIGATVDDSYITLVSPDTMVTTAPVTSNTPGIAAASGGAGALTVRPTASFDADSGGSETNPANAYDTDVNSYTVVDPSFNAFGEPPAIEYGTNDGTVDQWEGTGSCDPGCTLNIKYQRNAGSGNDESAILVESTAGGTPLYTALAMGYSNAGPTTWSQALTNGQCADYGDLRINIDIDKVGGGGDNAELWVHDIRIEGDNCTAGSGGPSTTPPAVSNVLAAYGTTSGNSITAQEGTLIDLTATVSDGDTGHTISAAEYSLDDSGFSSPVAMEATDGTFNSAVENVEDPAAPGKIDTSGWSLGDHRLYVHGQDDDGWGPASYATVNITAAPTTDNVTLSASNLASGDATVGAAYSFLKLDFTANANDADIDRIQVNRAGSAPDGDVSQVAIYQDTDTSGDWNAGDILLGTGTFSSSAVDIDITDQTVTTSTSTLLVVMTMDAGATTGNNIGATITDQSSITLVSPDTMNAYGGITSTLMNIVSEGDGGGIACSDCHGSWPQTSGAHGTHNATTDPEVNDTPCEPCHGDLSGYTTSHGNGAIDFTFTGDGGAAADYSAKATPGDVTGTCSGVDCHYENITPAWNTSGQLTCNSCHNNSALPDKHTVHLDSSSLPNSTNENECYVCHNTSADSSGATLANHGNKVNNVDFNSSYAYENGTPGTTNSGSATTCSAIICHNGAGTPAWSSTVTCGSCHGSGGPLPTGTTAGSHTAGATTSHANNDAVYTDCARCHANANNYKATKAGGDVAAHKNLTVDMGGTRLTSYTEVGGGGAGVNYGGDNLDNGTCDTSCHGNNTPTWGAAGSVDCGTCHGTAARDGDDRDGYPPTDLAGGSNAVKVGKHSQHMSESLSKSGSYCGLCHNGAGYGTSSHPDGTVDVVLDLTAAGGSATRTDNDPGADSCNNLTCHQDTTWDSAVTGGCSFCHSYPPTGTGSSTNHTATGGYGNIDDAARLLAAHGDCAVCHGIAAATPGDPNSGWGTPKDETSKSGDAYSITDHHRDGNVQMNGISDPNNDQSTEYVEATTGCAKACHPVTAIFDGQVQTNTVMLLELGAGGCTICHGGDVTGANSDSFWPGDGATTDSGASQNNDGLHTTHITLLAARHYNENITNLLTNNGNGNSDAKQKTLCEYCHSANVNDDGHGTGDDAEVFLTDISSVPTRFAKHLDQSADGDALYSGGVCSAVDCHNNTSSTVAWYSAPSSTCTMCHTPSGSGTVEPASGLHTTGTLVSSMPHDDSFATGGTCTTCHSGMPSLQTNGTTHANGTDNGNTVGNLGLNADLHYSQSANDTGTCFGPDNSGLTGCHNGVGDNGTWARNWDSTISYANDGSTECAGCHGGFVGDWTFGTDNVDADGSVSHDRDWDGATPGEVIGNHTGTAQADRCKICHGYGYAGVYDSANMGAHRDGRITFNDEMGYNGSPNFDCGTYCHSDNTGHGLETSGWLTTSNTVNCPPLACGDCHGASTPSAGVGTNSPHTSQTCDYCHTGHNSGTIQITNNATVGINYGQGGIDLGNSSGATGATEEAICNGCHQTSHTPWGKTQGSYTTGTVDNNTTWSTATWSSTNFSYKDGSIQSTHYGRAGVACSYCHDVHDTSGGTNNGLAPFLRGSWTSNPFPEDGAPQSAQALWPKGSSKRSENDGELPRAGAYNGALNNQLHGWQIEQNNNITFSETYSTFGGLCQLCHAQSTLETAWVGHEGAVSGFTGNTNNNIFRTGQRGGTASWNLGDMGYTNMTTTTTREPIVEGSGSSTYIGGFRNGRDVGSGQFEVDGIDTGNQAADPETPLTNNIAYGGGAVTSITVDDGTYDNNFHNFPCSKCHSPHASRLPRLMITNCLDVNHNAWDNSEASPAAWLPQEPDPNDNKAGLPLSHGFVATQLAYSPTAHNCHRYVNTSWSNGGTAGTPQSGNEGGWNTITPWDDPRW